jgi:hypothetical protein
MTFADRDGSDRRAFAPVADRADERHRGTAADDVTNATNRSPYPTLHLLREESIDRAVVAFPEAKTIYERNIRTLQALGPQGWAALQEQCRADAENSGNQDRRG